MPEESTEEFLARVTAERSPLTKQDEREAMIAVWKVRDLAKSKIPGGKEMVILEKVEQEGEGEMIFLGQLKPEDDRPSWAPQDSDVSITVLWRVRDSKHGIIEQSMDLYFISSSAVAKETTIFPPDSKRSIAREETTKEVYFPDKSDLQALSKLISSANVTT